MSNRYSCRICGIIIGTRNGNHRRRAPTDWQQLFSRQWGIISMTKAFVSATLFTMPAAAVHADSPAMPSSGRESIEWGHCPEVEMKLAARAYVARLSSSAFMAEPVLLKRIETVLGSMNFDAIHLKIFPTNAPPQEAMAASVAARNNRPLKFVQANRVPVDDLYAIAIGHPECRSDNVHCNDCGIALPAVPVARLPKP